MPRRLGLAAIALLVLATVVADPPDPVPRSRVPPTADAPIAAPIVTCVGQPGPAPVQPAMTRRPAVTRCREFAPGRVVGRGFTIPEC